MWCGMEGRSAFLLKSKQLMKHTNRFDPEQLSDTMKRLNPELVAKRPALELPGRSTKPPGAFKGHCEGGGDRVFCIPGKPVPKPRQTRADKWLKRPCVLRYREYADRLRAIVKPQPLDVHGLDLEFHLPMPKSWSMKKCQLMDGKPHRQKPDLDNLVKAVCDALLDRDEVIYKLTATKQWCHPEMTKTILKHVSV